MSSFKVSHLRMAVDQMKLGDIRAFDIDSSKRGTCPIYQQKTYYVKKEFCDHSDKYCGSGEVIVLAILAVSISMLQSPTNLKS